MTGRSSRRRLDARLQNAATPVFALGAGRKIIFFNQGCEALTGWKAAEVLGVRCDYQTQGDPQSPPTLAGILSPPPEVFQGTPLQTPMDIVHRSGRSFERMFHFFPLQEADGVGMVLGIITPLQGPSSPAPMSTSQHLHAQLAALRMALRERYTVDSILARGEAMQRVLEQVALARGTSAGVLICGEAGTGKEHVARVIHQGGGSGARAFVPLDCARLPAGELRRTLRRLLHADEETSGTAAARLPGTLYLKDVESLSRDAQEMLVEYYRRRRTAQGSTSAAIRLIGATTGNLSQALAEETLRSDFYYLLTPLRIELPPLRNRPEDLPLLAQAFLEEGNRDSEQQLGAFSEAVWEQFRAYRWPGNLDELQAVVELARRECSGPQVDVAHLPFRFRAGQDAQALSPPPKPRIVPLAELLARVEAEHIRAALREANHNKTIAAKLLGLTRPRLYRRLEALGIPEVEEH